MAFSLVKKIKYFGSLNHKKTVIENGLSKGRYQNFGN